jgi:hypothetical protein
MIGLANGCLVALRNFFVDRVVAIVVQRKQQVAMSRREMTDQILAMTIKK